MPLVCVVVIMVMVAATASLVWRLACRLVACLVIRLVVVMDAVW